MSETYHNLKERVRAFWQQNPCGTKFSDAEVGTRLFFERVEEHRYSKEWHIPGAADFAGTLAFTPTPAGTRLHWSWRTRPKGAARLLAPVFTVVGARQERRMWTALRDHLEAAGPARS